MTRLIITTVYDEVLHQLETLTRKNLDSDAIRTSKELRAKTTIIDRKYGYVDIALSNEYMIKQVELYLTTNNLQTSKEEVKKWDNAVKDRGVILTAQDIMIYRILLSHYINYNVNGVAKIKLDTIHNEYRGKAFMFKKGDGRYDIETFKAYIAVIRKLRTTTIKIDFGESKLKSFKYFRERDKFFFCHKLLDFKNEIKVENVCNIEIEYSLGDLGKYFEVSKQYGQLLPIEIYQLRFNQIDTFNMAIYISRMVVMNRKKKSSCLIYISTLLSKFNKYDMKGISTSMTYLEYLNQLDPIKRNKKIKHIEEQIVYVLDLLKSNSKIKDYSFSSKFQYKYIKAEELSVRLYFEKMR